MIIKGFKRRPSERGRHDLDAFAPFSYVREHLSLARALGEQHNFPKGNKPLKQQYLFPGDKRTTYLRQAQRQKSLDHLSRVGPPVRSNIHLLQRTATNIVVVKLLVWLLLSSSSSRQTRCELSTAQCLRHEALRITVACQMACKELQQII